PQAIPVGVLVTAPLPLPEFVTLSVGAGLLMVKIWAAEVPPPGAGVSTVTWAVAAVAISPAAMAAWSWVLLTKAVGRAVPFHCTPDAPPILPPAIPIVELAPPALALPEFIALSVGAGLLMVKIWAAEVPPPGAGVSTVTWAVPAVAISPAAMAA